jgi:hypothetical protein
LEFLPQVKGVVVEELGGQPREASQDSNFFPLCNASPGVYNSYRNDYMSPIYSSMHVMYCVIHVGFLDDMMIGCMVVPFHILSLL